MSLIPVALFGGLFARFRYNFAPRRAWLDGSVLTVVGGRGPRRCDLRTASVVQLHRIVPPMSGYGLLPVLVARQERDTPPVRLLLWEPGPPGTFPARQLRLLADVIAQRPSPLGGEAAKAVQRLRALADRQEAPPGIVVDWSHRTNPPGR